LWLHVAVAILLVENQSCRIATSSGGGEFINNRRLMLMAWLFGEFRHTHLSNRQPPPVD
jgi:hypothetical protein